MTRSIRASIALLGAACVGAACASGSPGSGGAATATAARSPDVSYGYMIPGPGVANTIGVNATDTILELAPRATIPTTVLNGPSTVTLLFPARRL